MGNSSGQDNGVTGAINLGNGSALITAKILGFVLALASTIIPINGPGDNFADAVYGSSVGGSGSAEGDVQSSNSPFPATMHNLHGSLIHQLTSGDVITIPVLFKTVSCERKVGSSDLWKLTVEWVKNGVESIAWKNGPPAYSQPILALKELFADTQKGFDPNALTSASTVKYFLPTGGYSNTNINAAVDSFIAGATPPRPNMKVANTLVMPIDDAAGLLMCMWAMKDSIDEEIIPRTSVIFDAQGNTDMQTIAVMWTAGSPPSDPATPNGIDGTALKLIDKRDVPRLLDGSRDPSRSIRVWTFGRNNSKDDIERSIRYGSRSVYDPNTIDGSARVVIEASSAPSIPSAPIAGVKYTNTLTRPSTDFKIIYTFEYAPMDSKDKLQLTQQSIDPSSVPTESKALVPVVDGSPSAPGGSGLALVMSHLRQLANGHIQTLGEFGFRTPQQAIEMDGSDVIVGNTIPDNNERKTELVACSSGDTLEALAAAKYIAVKAAQPFSPTNGFPLRRVRARRVHPTAVRFITEWDVRTNGYVDRGDKIRIKGRLGPMQTYGWVGVNVSDGKPFVNISSNLTRGSGAFVIQLGKVQVNGIGGTIVVYQRISGTTPALGTSSMGKTNSSLFLNTFPPGSARYDFADFDIVISDTSSTYDMAWSFSIAISQNFLGFPTVRGIPPGGIIQSGSAVNSGATGDFVGTGGPPSFTFGGLGITVDVPATDSFGFSSFPQT